MDADSLALLNQLLTLANGHAWIPLAAVAVGFIVRLSKSDKAVAWLPVNIPAAYRPWLSLGLGVVSGALAKLAAGRSWPEAVIGGIFAGVLPITGHELFVESLRGGREVGLPPAPPSAGVLLLLFVGACREGGAADRAADLVACAMACRAKGMEIAHSSGPCADRARRLDELARTDPDCLALFDDGGPGRFTCHDDGGTEGGAQ
jgi:hypothetical protein